MKVRTKYVTIPLSVLLLIGLIVFFLSNEAESAETIIEIGPSIVKKEFSNSVTVILQERWNDKYAVSLGYITEQKFDACPNFPNTAHCMWTVKQQLLIGAERIVRVNFETRWLSWLNRVSLSFGPYWFQRPSRISSCTFVIRLALDVRLWGRASIKYSHFSHGGTCDEITLINPNDPIQRPRTDDWNIGQDAVLLTWRF